MTADTERYREANDQLLSPMYDYDKAVQSFEWPRFTDTFDWATDWSDVIARDRKAVGIRVQYQHRHPAITTVD
ncbi:hypothetical protein [Mycobacterium kyogaense]|uniref:hypothetical protein n=1 Tax=Mycobacterium kyogaense TaxID=2212479 RepID=UPI000DADB2AA|nr:hypothetical protein [Mycobacterium kyogaense]